MTDSDTRPVVLSAIRKLTCLFCCGFLIAGCALEIVPRTDSLAPSLDGKELSVFGKITYLIDGETKLPYAPFRPAIQRPHLDLLRLEDGTSYQTHGVDSADGSFRWKMQPGHYVIGGIGQGTFGDVYRVAWPRLAFEIEPGTGPVYLGHLQLVGEKYTESYTLSTGTTGQIKGIRYRFSIRDELSRVDLPAGVRPHKSLIIHRPNMPIGEQLMNAWRDSKDQLMIDIFAPEQLSLNPY